MTNKNNPVQIKALGLTTDHAIVVDRLNPVTFSNYGDQTAVEN
jgi:hypothetical protein